MAIYCMQCGTQLPDTAMFCLKCGKPVGGAVQSTPQPEPKWEYCEIVYDDPQSKRKKAWTKTYSDIIFWAKGVGPAGTFNALPDEEFLGKIAEWGWDKVYPSTDSDADRKAVDALIARLGETGWELLPSKGESWFSYKFRRKVI